MKEIKREQDVYEKSRLYKIWLWMKESRQAIFGLRLFICTLLIAISANVLVGYNTDVIRRDIANHLRPPNAAHWPGTDQCERDVLVRLIYGARIFLTIRAITVFISPVIGGLIRTITGFHGGKLDNVLMRIAGIFLSLPSTLLAIAAIVTLGAGIVNIIVVIAISCAPRYAHIIHSSTLSIRDREFVEAARAIGTWSGHIIPKNAAPSAIGPVVVQVTLGVGKIITSAADLSFLGLGTNPPMPGWGAMLSEGKEFIRNLPYLVVSPDICTMFTTLLLSPLGDGLRDALDPRPK